MVTNSFDITVNASVERVWHALTTSDEIVRWLDATTVISDWHEHAPITFSCYDENGSIKNWLGHPMVWHGLIETFEINKHFMCSFEDDPTGLRREEYTLEPFADAATHVLFTQTCTDDESAQGYLDGNHRMLDMLKSYLEA